MLLPFLFRVALLVIRQLLSLLAQDFRPENRDVRSLRFTLTCTLLDRLLFTERLMGHGTFTRVDVSFSHYFDTSIYL